MSSGLAKEVVHSKVENGVGAIGPAAIHGKIRTLLVGSGSSGARVAADIQADVRRLLIGSVAGLHSNEAARSVTEVPLLGDIEHLGGLIVEHCIDEVQIALQLEHGLPKVRQIHQVAKALGIPVALRFELIDGAVPSKLDFTSPIACVSYNHHPSNRWPYRFYKRCIDVLVSAGMLIALLPLFALIALAIKFTSPGSVFFKQPRVGIRRREFKMLKFRTMVKNAEHLRKSVEQLNDARGASFKIIRDPRLTSIGGFLRRTSVDELPQLVNVLLGEMSLAGPRPIPLWVADQLDNTTYYRRFHVMPGLTGWWQVKGREQDFELMAEQDLYYVDNWSLSLDLRILLNTLPAVVRGHGAH